jgi:hypothetical protein
VALKSSGSALGSVIRYLGSAYTQAAANRLKSRPRNAENQAGKDVDEKDLSSIQDVSVCYAQPLY